LNIGGRKKKKKTGFPGRGKKGDREFLSKKTLRKEKKKERKHREKKRGGPSSAIVLVFKASSWKKKNPRLEELKRERGGEPIPP